MHVSIFSARFCRLARRSGQFWTPLLCGAGYKRSASSSQRASSLVTSATVGVAISHSAIPWVQSQLSAWPLSPDCRLGALIVTYTNFSSPAQKSQIAAIFCLATTAALQCSRSHVVGRLPLPSARRSQGCAVRLMALSLGKISSPRMADKESKWEVTLLGLLVC